VCTVTTVHPGAAVTPRVGWSRLYGLVALMAMTLTVDELVTAKGIVHTALRGMITLATFAAMALWVRAKLLLRAGRLAAGADGVVGVRNHLTFDYDDVQHESLVRPNW